MDKDYEEYGKLMIQAEILNGRIMEIKKRIADSLKAPPPDTKVIEDGIQRSP